MQVRTLLHCTALVLGVLVLLCVRAPVVNAQGAPLYLPVLFGPHPTQLYGSVAFQGNPQPGVEVALFRRTGDVDVVLDTATTDRAGVYRFVNIEPSAGATFRAAYVNKEYGNPLDPNNVYFCMTRDVTNVAFGAVVHLGDFDIADIVLSEPPHRATVTLPAAFRWLARENAASDSYYWVLFDSANATDKVEHRNLGNVDRFTLTDDMLGVLTYGREYGWYVGLTGETSYCESYYYRSVTLASTARR